MSEHGEANSPLAGSSGDATDWGQELLGRLAFASLVEQRRARRWGIFFKFAFLAYLILLLILYAPSIDLAARGGAPHTAMVEIQGTIKEGADASADRIVTGLRAAFEDENTAAVVLRINSPGGSPVQAGYINEEIRRLRAEHPDTPLYAVITDVCASGGYYVAAAADAIYANEASMVGSIGVLMNGFGFVETLDKLGVERRLLTAGEHKGLLDPFSPVKPEELAHIERLLDEIHRQFIEAVKEGRGEKLAGGEELFSGLIWTGEKSVELGLVDALGSTSYVAREVVGAEEVKDFTLRRGMLERLAERFAAQLGRSLFEQGLFEQGLFEQGLFERGAMSIGSGQRVDTFLLEHLGQANER